MPDASLGPTEDASTAPTLFGQRGKVPPGRLVLQSGALAYRRTDDGQPLVLLITKRRSKQWGIPKGRVKAHLSFAENAAKEAFEEAGVKGTVSPDAVGMFRATKRALDGRGARVIEVWVYLLEVAECLGQFPEQGKRRIEWVRSDVAAGRLQEPVLATLCDRLSRGSKSVAVLVPTVTSA
jgi:8-oxo-dGTP pyrophosphatase MutT (NUDIX family)